MGIMRLMQITQYSNTLDRGLTLGNESSPLFVYKEMM